MKSSDNHPTNRRNHPISASDPIRRMDDDSRVLAGLQSNLEVRSHKGQWVSLCAVAVRNQNAATWSVEYGSHDQY